MNEQLARPINLRVNPQPAQETIAVTPAVLEDYLSGLSAGDRAAVLTEIVKLTGRHAEGLLEQSSADPDMPPDAKATVSGLSRAIQQRAIWVASKEISSQT